MRKLKLSKSFALRNAGQILARMKAIDERVASLKTTYKNAALDECSHLLGKISGLEDNRNAPHKHIVDCLVDTKKELNEAVDFNEEQAFLKGYLHGTEIALNIDRDLFDEEINFIFFVYSENQDLLDKYRLALSSIKEFSELCGEGLQYYLSDDAEDICAQINNHNTTNEFLVVVVYESKCLPSIETMKALAADRHEDIYIHKDKGEENIGDLIFKFLVKTST